MAIVQNLCINTLIFTNEQWKLSLQNHTWVKIDFKVKENQWILIVSEYKGSWYGFRFHIAFVFKELPLIFGIILKKNIYNYLKWLLKHFFLFQLHSCMRTNFLSITAESYETLSSVKSDLKRFTKMENNTAFLGIPWWSSS